MVLALCPLQLSKPSIAPAPASPPVRIFHMDTSKGSPGSRGVTQDLCEKLHGSSHCVRDLDLLGSPSLYGKLNLARWRQNQWETAFAIFQYFACVFFLKSSYYHDYHHPARMSQTPTSGALCVKQKPSAGVTARAPFQGCAKELEEKIPCAPVAPWASWWPAGWLRWLHPVHGLCCRRSWKEAPPLKGTQIKVLKRLSSKFRFVAVFSAILSCLVEWKFATLSK